MSMIAAAGMAVISPGTPDPTIALSSPSNTYGASRPGGRRKPKGKHSRSPVQIRRKARHKGARRSRARR